MSKSEPIRIHPFKGGSGRWCCSIMLSATSMTDGVGLVDEPGVFVYPLHYYDTKEEIIHAARNWIKSLHGREVVEIDDD